MERAGTGQVVCGPGPFIEGGPGARRVVLVDIHYKAEASHDRRQADPQNGSQMPSWEYTALLDW